LIRTIEMSTEYQTDYENETPMPETPKGDNDSDLSTSSSDDVTLPSDIYMRWI